LELPLYGDMNLFDFIDKNISWDVFVKITDLIDIETIPDISKDVNGISIEFKRKPSIIREDAIYDLLPIHHLVNIRCKNDIQYFAQFFKVVSIDDGLIRMPLRKFQVKALDLFVNDPKVALSCSRQVGKTTIVTVYACWKFIFREYNTTAIIGNKKSTAMEVLERVQIGYESLPKFMQQPIVTYNKGDMKGTNGSKIFTSATTRDSISGKSVNDLIIDEVAKIPLNMWNDFWGATYPVIASAKKKSSISVIMMSTPYGDNHWKEIVDRGNLEGTPNWNGFKVLNVTYKDIPERNNKKWRDEQLAVMSLNQFEQDHETKFVVLENIYIDGKVLENIKVKYPISDSFINQKLKKYTEQISTYYSPIKGHKYIISIDPSEMTLYSKEGDNDNIGIQILDVTDVRKKIKQVLTINFKDHFDYLESSLILYILGKYYNDALIVGENNIAKQILNDLRTDYEYDNIYSEKKEIYGYRLTKSNKPMIAKIMKFLIENDILEINDDDTVKELKVFTKQLKAMTPLTDGLVTSLLAGLYFMTWKKNKIENLIGDESDGVYIKTGKELLKLSLDEDIDEDKELSDIIIQSNEDEELVQEILRDNGFFDEQEEETSNIMF